MADLIMSDWEKVLLAFCEPEGIEDFFNIRNAIREMMRQREALLAMLPFAQHDYRCEARNGVESCACGYETALAALPEHLRGDKDE